MQVQILKAGQLITIAALDERATLSPDGCKAVWPDGEFDAPEGCTLALTSGAAPNAPEPPTKEQLLAYAEWKRGAIAAGGISVNVAPAGAAPQLCEIGTDTAGLAFLANAVQLTATAPGTSYEWDQSEPVTITGAQVLQIQQAVGLFNQQLFTQKATIRSAINAGTITTYAQVDDPTSVHLPAWPANS